MPFKSAIEKEILGIIERLHNASHETYIVGGAIRDLMLGLTPKDYDIATAATPEQIKAIFRRNARIIGRRFRLVHYVTTNHKIVEISTFRKEPAEHEKLIDVKGKLRPNENTYGNASEDAMRRDLTVNAIFYDPINDKIVDFTGKSIDDLKDKKVRTIGDPKKRFTEDPVRILRALKLVGQYGFSMEEKTLAALKEHKLLIKNAATSRLCLELEKILKSPYSGKILSAFVDFDFMDLFLPNLSCEIRKDAEKKKLLMEIMTEWNLRVSQGRYRASISIALSAMCIPFMLEILELNDPDSQTRPRWQVEPALSEKFRNLLLPYHFPRRLMAVTREIILLQPILFKHKRNPHILRHSRFGHARELFDILNNVLWKNDELRDKWGKKS